MDSTESLLQTNSLLHESWQVVQDQVSFVGQCPPGASLLCSLLYILLHLLAYLLRALCRVGPMCVVWYQALHHSQQSDCSVASQAGVVDAIFPGSLTCEAAPESKAARPDESHPARADLAAARFTQCCVVSIRAIVLYQAIAAGSMAAVIQLLRSLLPFMSPVCIARFILSEKRKAPHFHLQCSHTSQLRSLTVTSMTQDNHPCTCDNHRAALPCSCLGDPLVCLTAGCAAAQPEGAHRERPG